MKKLKEEFKKAIQDEKFYAIQQKIYMILAILFFFVETIEIGFVFALITICCALERIILRKGTSNEKIIP